ncbi:MAG: FAD-dependent oxidoreductase [Pseudomonadota bacterium]
METDVAIIGGGLAGLALADVLTRAGVDWQLLEARGRLGGRILSAHVSGHAHDLGPAWVWPHNPLVIALADRLGLDFFPQFSDGRLVFQEASGAVRRDLDFSTMAGALRVAGGISALTDGLASLLPLERLHLKAPVTQISRQGGRMHITVGGTTLTANRVALALPPRLAATIDFTPELPRAALESMAAIPTWMAGQAKAVAVYQQPFWREAGLSGDGISHRGPMVEIHDASPASAAAGALFGFIGVPARARLAHREDLRAAILDQLTAMFGADAGAPAELLLQDWAGEAATATQADFEAPPQHPHYGMPAALQNLFDGNLILAGSEVAPRNGGFVEGALEAAEAAALRLRESATQAPS